MLADFINQNYGSTNPSPVPPDGIPGQCVNLASSWSIAIGGGELTGPTAYSIWQNFRSAFYQVIPYNGSNQPAPGDIVFFAPYVAAIGTGWAGHVDICVNASPSGFQGFDADWGTLAAIYVAHSYTGVVGWFHPVNSSGGSNVTEVTDLRSQLVQTQVQVEQTRMAHAAKNYLLYLVRPASAGELDQWKDVDTETQDGAFVGSTEYQGDANGAGSVWQKYIPGYPKSEINKKVAARASAAIDLLGHFQALASQGDTGAAQKIAQIQAIINS